MKFGGLFLFILVSLVIYGVISAFTLGEVNDVTNDSFDSLGVARINMLISEIQQIYTVDNLYGDMVNYDSRTDILPMISGNEFEGFIYVSYEGDIYLNVIYNDICYKKGFLDEDFYSNESVACLREG